MHPASPSAASPSAPSALSVTVFGGLSARRDGVDVDLGGPRQRAVLAVLLLARGAPVSADRLVDLVWDERPPANPAGVLQSYVSHLRRALEPHRQARERVGLLTWQASGYACRVPDDVVDVRRFERLVARGVEASASDAVPLLTEALGLYRGDPYPEWQGQAWATGEATRLAELRAVATEHLMAARLETGPAAVLVPELEALAEAEPLREERWRLLALALYRSSRQSDALAALRRARSLLSEELGIDPGPALRELEAQVLAQSPRLARPAPEPAAVTRAAPPERPGTPGVVERDGELRRLHGLLGEALAGSGCAVLVEGPAGIGKSRLLAEVRRAAGERGARVLTARGTLLEQDFGYGVVRQLLEPVVADPVARPGALGGAAAPAAGVFDTEGSRPEGAFAVLHALYWVVVNLSAARPVVVVVDDLQWCDAASLRFLAYLVPRLEGLPVLLALALRTGEASAAAALVAEVARDPAVDAVRPAPLSAGGVADLVRRRLGGEPAPAFAAACHRTTRGNPLLLQQLLRALEADGVPPDASHADTVTAIGSRAVSGIVLLRLGRLPAPTGDVARAVAVLGDGAALPVVAELAGTDEAAAARAVAALAAAEILGPEHPLAFVHPLVRDAVYRSLAPGERELAHERAAGVLRGAGASPEQVAAHVLLVPPRGDPAVGTSVDTLLRAASRVAAERGAPESAARYLRRLLDEPHLAGTRTTEGTVGRAGVLAELGALEALTDGAAALTHLREAHRLTDDPAGRARIAVLLAFTLIFAGPRGEVTGFARRAAEEAAAPGLLDTRQALLALGRLGGWMHGVVALDWRSGDGPPQPSGEGLGARMLASASAWELVVGNRDRERSMELARFALADGVLLAGDPGLFWAVAAFVLDIVDEDLESFWDAALSIAYRQGSLFASLATHLWRGHALWWLGELAEAEQSLRTSIDQSVRWAAPSVGVTYGEAYVVGVLLDRGEVATARAFFHGMTWRGWLGDSSRMWVEAHVRLLLAEGRAQDALDRLDADTPLLADAANPVWAPWRSLRARALAMLGRREAAVRLAAEEVEVARAWGAPRVLGRSLRVLGEVSGEAGEAPLREAVALLAPTRSRLDLAWSRVALARLVAPAEAVDLLRAALEVAEACGADELRAVAAAGLAERGAAVPEQPTASRRLTTTQRRVAALSDSGLEPREIAAQMFLTPHAVDVALAVVREAREASGAAGA